MNEKPVENKVYFDLSASMSSILASDEIFGKMYHGIGQFVDIPTESLYSHIWTSSVRTKSVRVPFRYRGV
ncbi:hypothetical protein OnM2_095009 [Erysiphe neolycopersici]|uniref:Uncharacterized protein n=1 Tax=Erysiphe neolycopersici TaxID=212602 RepID=A0A420HBF3_9PEZI|nr:hypothetical protein OnM2_095009 [Erysiphe neolycopersici]